MESPEWKDKIGRVFNVGGGGACEVTPIELLTFLAVTVSNKL